VVECRRPDRDNGGFSTTALAVGWPLRKAASQSDTTGGSGPTRPPMAVDHPVVERRRGAGVVDE
jgi:hypothetical protein